ncbi:MAG: hypothetical protein ACLGPL_08355, partial [Acidobacteriota bacterium]
MKTTDLIFWSFLLLYIGQGLFAIWLERENLRHLRRFGWRVPKGFEGHIDETKLSEISGYTAAKARLGLFRYATAESLTLFLILSGFFPWLDGTVSGVGSIAGGLLFFMAPGLALYLCELPFDYYNAFVIEGRFGFNRSTLRLWLTDQLKSGAISFVFLSALLSAVLFMVGYSPDHWWLCAFGIVSAVQILLVV